MIELLEQQPLRSIRHPIFILTGDIHRPVRPPHLRNLPEHVDLLRKQPIRADNSPSCIQEGALGPHHIAYVCFGTYRIQEYGWVLGNNENGQTTVPQWA